MQAIIELFTKVSMEDAIIISAFLLINLVIGIYFSRGIHNIKEYALGGRNFSTGTLVATIVATKVCGFTVPFIAYETYQNGLYYIIPSIADGLSFLIIAYFFAPRMYEFLGKLSVAEAMGDMYGNVARACTALSGIILSVGGVAMQFTILTALLTNFMGISGFYAVLFSSSVVLIYSTFGGIKAVTFTDVMQFFTFGVVIPMTALCIWFAIDNNAMAVLKVLETHPTFDFSKVLDYNDSRFMSTAFLLLFFLIPCIEPANFQRISMARNVKQAMKSFAIAGVIIILCEYFVFHFIGLLLLADPANTAEKLAGMDTNNLVNYIIDNYLEVGFKGVFVIGIMALCMSTTDSYINAASILLSHDLPKSIGINVGAKWELRFARLASLIIGIFALAFSLYYKNAWDLIYLSYIFYMPIVTVPLILAILGFRSSTLPVLLGMFGGFTTVCLMKIYTDAEDVVIPGMLVNLVIYTASHYLTGASGGWVGVNNASFDEIKREREDRIHDFCAAIKNFSLIQYLKNSVSKQESTFVYLGFFCIVSTFFSIYALPKIVTDQHKLLISIVSYSSLILATILISYPAWIEKFKNQIFISSVAHTAIFVVLILSSALLVLISNFGQLQTVILTASLLTAAILLRWHVVLLFIVVGMLATASFYKDYSGHELVFENVTMEFSMIYVLLMASAISIVFLKPKEDALEVSEARSSHLWEKISDMDMEVRKANELKTEFLNNINHEVRTPMTGITSLGQALWESYDALPEAKRKEYVKLIANSSDRLHSLMTNILDLSSLGSLKMELNLKKVDLSELVKNRIKHCKKLYLEDKALRFKLDIEDGIYIKCDEYHITHTIDNLIINAIAYSNADTDISIALTKADGVVTFTIRDEGIGIPKDELFDIFRPFTVSSKTRSSAGGRGIGLALCFAAITAHHGKIWAESDGKSWAEFKFSI